MKGNKGITLIALVITIIVLLILAGVSIAMLTGENSILGRASQASAENQLGAANDAVSLHVADKVAEFYEEAYTKNNTTALTKGLDDYLAQSTTGVTVSGLSGKIDNDNIKSGVTVKDNKDAIEVKTETVTATNTLKITYIILRLQDNSGVYTSVGTVTNGKVEWKIYKPSDTIPSTVGA